MMANATVRTSFDQSVIDALTAGGYGKFRILGFDYISEDGDLCLQIIDRGRYADYVREWSCAHSNPEPTKEEIESSWNSEPIRCEVEGEVYAFITQ